jgi:tRNA pseudouridine synthase 10
MDKLGVMAQEIHSTLDGQYEFDTFLIGTSLATQFIEKEDEVRSKYRIRGKISIKSHITSEVREKFQRLTSAKEVFEKPDLMITLNIFWNKDHTISTRARSMIAAGRYTKNQRGISQREPKPQTISSLADNQPNIANNSNVRSVEAIISDTVIAATECSEVRFSWLGSEDKNSLVLGRGRPFYVEVLNPKKRTFLNNTITVNEHHVSAQLDFLSAGFPRSPLRSRTITRILIRCLESGLEPNLNKLDSLAGTTVKLKSKFSLSEKKIYSVMVNRVDNNQFYLTIDADSGLSIKQFVGGMEYANPNVSMLVAANCDCVYFDILDVIVQ